MFQIIKQYKAFGRYFDEPIMIVYSEEDAHKMVQYFRKKEQNQLYYYREVN